MQGGGGCGGEWLPEGLVGFDLGCYVVVFGRCMCDYLWEGLGST